MQGQLCLAELHILRSKPKSSVVETEAPKKGLRDDFLKEVAPCGLSGRLPRRLRRGCKEETDVAPALKEPTV